MYSKKKEDTLNFITFKLQVIPITCKTFLKYKNWRIQM